MAKIIYFTASIVPTAQERADIDAINASIHTLNVSNGSVDSGLGMAEECDFVAGTVPPEYAGKPTFDPSAGELDDNQVIVTDGDAVTVDGASVTLAVSGNAITGATLPTTNAVVANAGTIPVQNSAGAAIGIGTLTVANNNPTNIRLPATIAGVSSGSQNITDAAGKASTATRTVSAGAITTTILAATDCIVKNGNTFTAADGGTITVAVAASVPTFTYTAP
ncbi:hypothetical protein [Brucella anthropi]|uniref:hypothetical protein n=1 Tax=Brucella anthropi TaxID=529 RepID=UPI003208CDB3